MSLWTIISKVRVECFMWVSMVNFVDLVMVIGNVKLVISKFIKYVQNYYLLKS